MDIIEKRDFIHSHLHKADENTINEFYEKLHKEELLKAKLESRALHSERDIQSGKIYSRTDVERKVEAL